MALVFLLHHNFYYFSCDRKFELQSRIVNVVAWLCCQIFLNSIFFDSCARFNLITDLSEDRYNAKSSWIHTMVESFMTLRFPALIHHADSSISFWCLLCHINYFRCVQYPDYIRAAFIYETAYFTMYNFFAQVMRVALTCIIGSVYSSRFLVLLLSA